MGQSLPVTCLTQPDDLKRIEAAWRRLESQSDASVFFQSFDWCAHVWRTRLAAGVSAKFDGRVIVVGSLDDPDAIWPLSVQRNSLGLFATDLSDPYGQYSDILLVADSDLDQVMDAALGELRRWRLDGLVLRKVRADSTIEPWLSNEAFSVDERFEAPVAELSRFSDFGEYRKSLKAKTRKNLRNYRNRVARQGRLVHTVANGQAECADMIEQCYRRRLSWLEDTGTTSTAFSDATFPDIISGLAGCGNGELDVRAVRLQLHGDDGRVVELSLQFGFVHNNIYYAYMSAKNPEFNAFSPGRLHLEDLLEALFDAGVEKADFLVPAMPYKLSFATDSVGVGDYMLPFSNRGWVAIRGWHGALRPLLKKALVSMPSPVRRSVMRIASINSPTG